MKWILIGIGVVIGAWLCLIAFNLFTTSLLRRQLQLSSEQMKVYVILRDVLSRRNLYSAAMQRYLVLHVKSLDEMTCLEAGSLLRGEDFEILRFFDTVSRTASPLSAEWSAANRVIQTLIG